jgi:hypothetical protein
MKSLRQSEKVSILCDGRMVWWVSPISAAEIPPHHRSKSQLRASLNRWWASSLMFSRVSDSIQPMSAGPVLSVAGGMSSSLSAVHPHKQLPLFPADYHHPLPGLFTTDYLQSCGLSCALTGVVPGVCWEGRWIGQGGPEILIAWGDGQVLFSD